MSLACIALAVYFESRGEPTEGQLAVAQVKQGYYWQDHPIRDRCQFSFWCDGKSDDPKNVQAFYNAFYIAWLSGEREDLTGGATHYHAAGVNPQWASSGKITKTMGNHIFYKGI